ncbi:MAG: peptidase T [Oscillospiraceae bacterium]|nr:peptidase T [Oscillospiraceae bacterium]
MNVLDRFLNYVTYDTQSDETSATCPSTAKQKVLGAALVEEMKAIGIADAFMDENGYVYGTVPGDPELPTIGLIAHMDTAPQAPGANVKPRVVEFTGEDVCLNEEKGMYLRASDYPYLNNCIGKHLVVTDGNTLLGADNKAGVAEIMACAEYLIQNKPRHATLKIGFTPDEEIGRGADEFDVDGFAADYAYTVDGGELGGVEYETFNAAAATVTIKGLSIHPGAAKNKLINASQVAMEFHAMLPVHERPESTEGYEGFCMLRDITSNIEEAVMHYIVRDHDDEKFEQKKDRFYQIAVYLDSIYGEGTVEVEMNDSYYNMRRQIEPVMYVVDRARAAMERLGITPYSVPVRGGTDGARLSYMGLPCPNLCTGGMNFHGRYEYAVVEEMESCARILVEILTDPDLSK